MLPVPPCKDSAKKRWKNCFWPKPSLLRPETKPLLRSASLMVVAWDDSHLWDFTNTRREHVCILHAASLALSLLTHTHSLSLSHTHTHTHTYTHTHIHTHTWTHTHTLTYAHTHTHTQTHTYTHIFSFFLIFWWLNGKKHNLVLTQCTRMKFWLDL